MVQSELIGVGLPNRTTIIALPLHNPRTSAFFQKITGMVTTRYQTQAFELCKVQKMHLLATKSQRAIKEKENGFLACKWKFQQQCARRTDKNTMKCFIEDNGFRHMKIQISEQCASQILKKERNTRKDDPVHRPKANYNRCANIAQLSDHDLANTRSFKITV